MKINRELSNDDLIVVDDVLPWENSMAFLNAPFFTKCNEVHFTEKDEDRVFNVDRYSDFIDLEISDGSFLESIVFPIPEDATEEQKELWYHPVQNFSGKPWDSIIKDVIGVEVVKSHIMATNCFFESHADKKLYHYPNLHSLDHTDDHTTTMLYWGGDFVESDVESEFILFDNRRENIDFNKPLMYNSIPMVGNRAVFFKSNRMWTKSRAKAPYTELEYAFTWR